MMAAATTPRNLTTSNERCASFLCFSFSFLFFFAEILSDPKLYVISFRQYSTSPIPYVQISHFVLCLFPIRLLRCRSHTACVFFTIPAYYRYMYIATDCAYTVDTVAIPLINLDMGM